MNVWQQSYELCLTIYQITAKFPNEERYGLTSQIRRCAVSIPSNMAEGYGIKTTLDYMRMLYISYGSVCEPETQILLAGDLGFIDKGELELAKKRHSRDRKNVTSADKIFRKQTLSASGGLTPGVLGPSSPTNLEKNHIYYQQPQYPCFLVVNSPDNRRCKNYCCMLFFFNKFSRIA